MFTTTIKPVSLGENRPFANYFDKNLKIFKACGLWIPSPSERWYRKIFFYTYTTIMLTYLVIYQPAESGVMFIAPDLDTFLRSLRDQLNHFNCFYKLYVWFRHRRLILGLMDTLRDPVYNYPDLQVAGIVRKNKTEADRWMLLFLAFVNSICFNMTLMICYLFLFQAEEQYSEGEDGERVYAQQLAVNLWTPFTQHTRKGFMWHFVFEIIALDAHAWMIVGLDTMFTSLVSCISAHLDILCEAFRTIRPRCQQRLGMAVEERLHDPPELQEAMRKEMRKCCIHLDMLLDVSNQVEELYHIQTFLQVMISLFEMCFCLYLLSGSLDENLGPELTYLVSTSFELLLYCWFGNSVTESSDALTQYIYEGDWLSSNAGFKKSMLITMTRMQRPICITIGKFTPLTFTTFLSMARVAYSFFTVLKSDAFD